MLVFVKFPSLRYNLLKEAVSMLLNGAVWRCSLRRAEGLARCSPSVCSYVWESARLGNENVTFWHALPWTDFKGTGDWISTGHRRLNHSYLQLQEVPRNVRCTKTICVSAQWSIHLQYYLSPFKRGSFIIFQVCHHVHWLQHLFCKS